MGITSLQVCMDSSDWLQGAITEEGSAGMDSSPISTTPTGNGGGDHPDSHLEGINLSRPLIERRLRPQQEQSLKCPRCESSHTKFCYYNNYSLSQPRYFCKTCRRYWTKGGTLRNIPVGGGCRKNTKKTSSSKKSSTHAPTSPPNPAAAAMIPHHSAHAALPIVCYDNTNSTDLQLAFPEQLQFSGIFNNAAGTNGNANGNPNFPIEFMDSKYEALILGGNHEFDPGFTGGEFSGNAGSSTYFNGGFCSPLGFSALEHGSSSGTAGVFDNCGRLLQPYDHHHNHHHHQMMDVKPAAKMLAIEWNDNHHNSDPGYGFGSWTGLMNNGYGSSAANPLV